MNLRDIQYFVSVAEHKHFGKAAQECNISQPTLSMQLKKLEETLNVTLFERTNRKVMLTAVGEEVLKQARIVLAASKQMKQVAKISSDPFGGEVTIGAFPTLAPYLLPMVMPKIGRALPKLSVNLVEEKTDNLIIQLEEGHIDCALLAFPVHAPFADSISLFKEPFYLAAPRGHKLAKRKKLRVEDLGGHKLLLLDEGHCLREQALEVCRFVGIQESQHFRATSLETLRQMVASGSAVTLMPKLALRNERNIIYVSFTKAPSRHIGLFFRKTTAQKILMERLAELIAETATTGK